MTLRELAEQLGCCEACTASMERTPDCDECARHAEWITKRIEAWLHETVTFSPHTMSALQAEGTRARKKFPSNRFLLAALTEEVGELAQALLQGAPRHRVQAEALQVATVALRIYEEGDATFASLTDEDKQQ